jgi:hypothetical protein
MTKDEEELLGTLTPSAAPAIARLDTALWFDSAHAAPAHSPIDEFLENLYSINKLYLQAQGRGDYTSMLGSLVYLGMVSAAEGYFRSLLRRLILTDEVCQANASSRMVSYGAAVHHEPDLLPEALLEGISLASAKAVAGELKGLCSVTQMNKESVPHQLQLLFDNFEDICQIRHCGIHRFGKLGSQQAFRLGIGKFRVLLEKPLNLNITHLQDIAEALEALISGVNSYCFSDIIKRTHTASPAGRDRDRFYAESWQMEFEVDRARFEKYYSIFSSSQAAEKSQPIERVYSAFMAFVKDYDTSPNKNKK